MRALQDKIDLTLQSHQATSETEQRAKKFQPLIPNMQVFPRRKQT